MNRAFRSAIGWHPVPPVPFISVDEIHDVGF